MEVTRKFCGSFPRKVKRHAKGKGYKKENRDHVSHFREFLVHYDAFRAASMPISHCDKPRVLSTADIC